MLFASLAFLARKVQNCDQGHCDPWRAPPFAHLWGTKRVTRSSLTRGAPKQQKHPISTSSILIRSHHKKWNWMGCSLHLHGSPTLRHMMIRWKHPPWHRPWGCWRQRCELSLGCLLGCWPWTRRREEPLGLAIDDAIYQPFFLAWGVWRCEKRTQTCKIHQVTANLDILSVPAARKKRLWGPIYPAHELDELPFF